MVNGACKDVKNATIVSIVIIVLNIDNNDFRFSRRRNPRCRPLRKFKVDFLVHRNKVDKIDVYAMLKAVADGLTFELHKGTLIRLEFVSSVITIFFR